MPLIKAIVYSFESMAERSNITLEAIFDNRGSENKSILHYYDKDKLEKIVYNIMSNAFKYTPKGGKVSISAKLNEGLLALNISDTGKGIDPKDIPHIFDRFYRVEGSEQKGSGIGLALSKELVELHNGQIEVESQKGKGTHFLIRMPTLLNLLPKSVIIQEPSKTIQTSEGIITQDPTGKKEIATENNEEQPLALIVEDNKDLQSYIQDVLSLQYQVMLASDGLQGERMAIEHIPDIIISDVMMAKKDGFELCHDLKNNIKTSHIPIVMLTAKAGHENKMEGLLQGADAYLTKPFMADELLVRMKNLIELRMHLWQKLKEANGVLIDDLELSSMDDTLLKKVFGIIEAKLDDETLSVETLSSAVGFSRAQLNRKLKALLNKSPKQLINEIRLNKAYHLLTSNTGTVSEIAYAVGYSNMSYFSKRFKEKFGITPSEIPIEE